MKNNVKGFAWSGFIQPVNQQTPTNMIVYSGNFVKELVLPNALKIRNLKMLADRLNKYIDSHNGNVPDLIRVTRRQYCQYEEIFPRFVLTVPPLPIAMKFQGIPLKRHGE